MYGLIARECLPALLAPMLLFFSPPPQTPQSQPSMAGFGVLASAATGSRRASKPNTTIRLSVALVSMPR
jgi:hypothetical protein